MKSPAADIAPSKQQLLLLLAQWGDSAEEPDMETLRENIGELVDLMHEADIADTLESIPLPQRLVVWGCAAEDSQAEILLELSDKARLPLNPNPRSHFS
ncbi:MAG: magnesium transporter MgtE N-terminal domain-containing protein [Gammaproteobacteria bacterium WSBS_2016_MAG_OTU1]